MNGTEHKGAWFPRVDRGMVSFLLLHAECASYFSLHKKDALTTDPRDHFILFDELYAHEVTAFKRNRIAVILYRE